MWPNPQETADSATFVEEILNGKFYFFCSGWTDNLFYILPILFDFLFSEAGAPQKCFYKKIMQVSLGIIFAGVLF